MPWTDRQKRFLLSKNSPLTQPQRAKMLGELHQNPSLGHASKVMTLKQMATPKKKKQ